MQNVIKQKSVNLMWLVPALSKIIKGEVEMQVFLCVCVANGS